MRKTYFTILFLGATLVFAQKQDSLLLIKEIPVIKDNVFRQRQEIDALTKKINSQENILNQQKSKIETLIAKDKLQEDVIDSLRDLSKSNKNEITNTSNILDAKIRQADIDSKKGISKLDKDVTQNRLYWVIASLLLFSLGAVIYWLLSKRISMTNNDTSSKIKKAMSSLEEEGVRLDSKLIEILEKQLKIGESKINDNSNDKKDHSLALKVADEIIRIQKNLSHMDESVRGLKQLNSSVQRIQDNFAANGYEIVEMLGKEYKEGMKVTANFIPSEDFKIGEQIITRIIKPQVNFKEEMIQAAQIEVSVGE